MHSTELQKLLINHTVEYSRHADHRRYIGLSHVGECELVNFREYQHGNHISTNGKLKSALAYALESVLVDTLDQLGLYRQGRELTAFGGLVRGHTDGEIIKDGQTDLLEIKTVEQAAWIPAIARLPRRVHYQVQAYMHYGGYKHAHVVYLARADGCIRVIGVTYQPGLGRRIEQILYRLVQAAQTGLPPACTCGRCKL